MYETLTLSGTIKLQKKKKLKVTTADPRHEVILEKLEVTFMDP